MNKPITIKALKQWLEQAEYYVGPDAIIEIQYGDETEAMYEPFRDCLRAVDPQGIVRSNLS